MCSSGLLLEERGVLRSLRQVSAAAATARHAARQLGRSHQRHLFADVEPVHRARAGHRQAAGPRCMVDIRGKPHAARVVKPPFVRNGKVIDRDLDKEEISK